MSRYLSVFLSSFSLSLSHTLTHTKTYKRMKLDGASINEKDNSKETDRTIRHFNDVV